MDFTNLNNMRILKASSTLKPQLLEYIGSGSWRVRWNISKEQKEEAELYEYVEAELGYKAAIEELKTIVVNWVRDNFQPNSFYIDGHKYWASDAERATIKSQCESDAENSTISLTCDDSIITLKAQSVVLQVMMMIDNYSSKYKKVVETLVNEINQCSTIEEINELNFKLELPEEVHTTQVELGRLASNRQKNSKENQAILFAKMTINATPLTDNQAISVKNLHPEWKEFIGKSLSTGFRVLHEDALYKVRQDINVVLENQPPSIDTAALYEEINETHDGTKADPIPYNNNMALELGKYYIQDDIIYMCTRDTGQAVYQDLSDLVGIYVQIAE